MLWLVCTWNQVYIALSQSVAMAQLELSTNANSKILLKSRILEDLLILNPINIGYKFPLLISKQH